MEHSGYTALNVIPSTNELCTNQLVGHTVIVVNAMRTNVNIINALEQGCESIIPVETIREAKLSQHDHVLYCGERYDRAIPLFDLGNSPSEYKDQHVKNKTLVMTTNGTRAICKASKAEHLLIGSMNNAASCVQQALQWKNPIALLCAGDHGGFTLEDGLCAGRFIHLFQKHCTKQLKLNDMGSMLFFSYLHNKNNIDQAFLRSNKGQRLVKIGQREDVLICAQEDISECVPIYKDGKITIASMIAVK